jgi:hypothetical protein
MTFRTTFGVSLVKDNILGNQLDQILLEMEIELSFQKKVYGKLGVSWKKKGK